MNMQEKPTVAIPESIELNGQTYVVKDTPALMAFRSAVAQAEKSKLYSTFETLRSQIETLKASNVVQSSAPFDISNMLDQMAQRFVTREDLKSTLQEVVQPVLSATEHQRVNELNQYRERLIRENEGRCIPELIKGDTKEALDKSLEESIILRAKYPAPVIPVSGQGKVEDPLIRKQATDPAFSGEQVPYQAPVAPAPSTPSPRPSIPEVPSRVVPEVTQGPNVRSMTMKEFEQKREQLLSQLENEYGN